MDLTPGATDFTPYPLSHRRGEPEAETDIFSPAATPLAVRPLSLWERG